MLEILRTIRPLLYHAFSELVATLNRKSTQKSEKRHSFKDGYDELLAAINSSRTKVLDAVMEDVYL